MTVAAQGPALAQDAQQRIDAKSWLRYWNEVAVNASGLDHTAPALNEDRIFREQMGPGRASRAMAIVHIAIFDAVNSIAGGYQSYTGLPPAPENSSMRAAIALAAHDTLVAMFPAQAASFDRRLAEEMARLPNRIDKARGIAVGRQAAAAILALRANDGSQHAEPLIGVDYLMTDKPGEWRMDPMSKTPMALGAHWGEVRPFVLKSADQFRCPTPPEMGSPAFNVALQEVKRLGGDGVVTPTERTADQTHAGIYWAYDGTPSLCAPPRLYNQITVQIADQMGTKDTAELARLLALVHVSMADAGIAIWESKYFYKVCRPVTGIRETATADGGDLNFTPLGAPASNMSGPNFTPPFPAYPSGHAGFGGALFQMLRDLYGTDGIPFTFVSDEYNGVTRDNQGNVRPLVPRSFSTLSEAEEENGQSRIYLGIHWSFDKTEGIAQGRRIADYVFANAFKKL
jgi:hypothetical protein